jgi:2-C-methyl-D-erythritol 4-phosphate cytidylyltransferase
LTVTVGAIVAAAGSGSRLGKGSKALVQLNGRTTLARVLELFLALDEVDRIVVVAPPSRLENAEREVQSLRPRKPVLVKAGGESRQASVRVGLAALGECDFVLVHDAARPLATARLFAAVVDAVRAGADAAVPGISLSDTVKRVDGDRVVETVERDDLVAVQTPQAFRAAALRAAHARGGDATDDAALVEQSGGVVVVVAGDRRNIKITGADDLALAAALAVEVLHP